MAVRELLLDTFVHMPPLRILDGVDASQAARRPADGLHSIAETVAHLSFWQTWFLDRCEGRATPMPAHAADGWPPVAEADWPALVARFEGGLLQAVALEDDGRLEKRIDPAIEFPPLAQYTVGDALVHVAQHNAHHLGQVIVLRQLLGCWPPSSGSWTW